MLWNFEIFIVRQIQEKQLTWNVLIGREKQEDQNVSCFQQLQKTCLSEI